ncbi:unnamed protein product [Brassica napus]|uniref:(rape) hypothetical protein n=1 Tax=Brassica napus TaxID=3708 RepID=A0A816Q516_BRANA|nr:unnamed protein product [Brassica napus]
MATTGVHHVTASRLNPSTHLESKPYFNEPAYERTKGTPSGEAYSKVYSENVYISSLRTMVYGMRKSPKHFEEFVRSHYFERAHDILKAANGYIDGAPVCSIVKGTSQVESMKFRTDTTRKQQGY